MQTFEKLDEKQLEKIFKDNQENVLNLAMHKTECESSAHDFKILINEKVSDSIQGFKYDIDGHGCGVISLSFLYSSKIPKNNSALTIVYEDEYGNKKEQYFKLVMLIKQYSETTIDTLSPTITATYSCQELTEEHH